MFQVGQRVECINGGDWCPDPGLDPATFPKLGTVYVVAEYGSSVISLCGYYVRLKGMPDNYAACFFRPLNEDPKRVEETMEKHFRKFLSQPVPSNCPDPQIDVKEGVSA